MSPDIRSVRVLLVREWDVQTTGPGCCGRLGSATVTSLTDTVTAAVEHDPAARGAGERP